MKVYVAAKFEEKARARAFMDKVEKLGHIVTHDWTKEDSSGKSRLELAPYLTKCAIADWIGVRDAQCLIILPHPNGKGMYVEMGIAIERAIPIIVADDYQTQLPIFNMMDNVYEAAGEAGAIELLERIAR